MFLAVLIYAVIVISSLIVRTVSYLITDGTV